MTVVTEVCDRCGEKEVCESGEDYCGCCRDEQWTCCRCENLFFDDCTESSLRVGGLFVMFDDDTGIVPGIYRILAFPVGDEEMLGPVTTRTENVRLVCTDLLDCCRTGGPHVAAGRMCGECHSKIETLLAEREKANDAGEQPEAAQ